MQWQNKSPKADDLLHIKKSIKSLRSQLRWKLVEVGCLEEVYSFIHLFKCGFRPFIDTHSILNCVASFSYLFVTVYIFFNLRLQKEWHFIAAVLTQVRNRDISIIT